MRADLFYEDSLNVTITHSVSIDWEGNMYIVNIHWKQIRLETFVLDWKQKKYIGNNLFRLEKFIGNNELRLETKDSSSDCRSD